MEIITPVKQMKHHILLTACRREHDGLVADSGKVDVVSPVNEQLMAFTALDSNPEQIKAGLLITALIEQSAALFRFPACDSQQVFQVVYLCSAGNQFLDDITPLGNDCHIHWGEVGTAHSVRYFQLRIRKSVDLITVLRHPAKCAGVIHDAAQVIHVVWPYGLSCASRRIFAVPG